MSGTIDCLSYPLYSTPAFLSQQAGQEVENLYLNRQAKARPKAQPVQKVEDLVLTGMAVMPWQSSALEVIQQTCPIALSL